MISKDKKNLTKIKGKRNKSDKQDRTTCSFWFAMFINFILHDFFIIFNNVLLLSFLLFWNKR